MVLQGSIWDIEGEYVFGREFNNPGNALSCAVSSYFGVQNTAACGNGSRYTERNIGGNVGGKIPYLGEVTGYGQRTNRDGNISGEVGIQAEVGPVGASINTDGSVTNYEFSLKRAPYPSMSGGFPVMQADFGGVCKVSASETIGMSISNLKYVAVPAIIYMNAIGGEDSLADRDFPRFTQYGRYKFAFRWSHRDGRSAFYAPVSMAGLIRNQMRIGTMPFVQMVYRESADGADFFKPGGKGLK